MGAKGHDEGRGVEQDDGARGRGVAETRIEGQELEPEQDPRANAGPQRAVALEQPHAAQRGPCEYEHAREQRAQSRLQDRRDAGTGDLDGDLVDAPAGAAEHDDDDRAHIEPVGGAQRQRACSFGHCHGAGPVACHGLFLPQVRVVWLIGAISPPPDASSDLAGGRVSGEVGDRRPSRGRIALPPRSRRRRGLRRRGRGAW